MKKCRILVTGGAGFIGSNIVKALLSDLRVEKVLVLDNLSTGYKKNILPFAENPKFSFQEGDIRDYKTCIEASKDADMICHQAALCSVPRSINDPISTNDVNVGGTLNLFYAAKENKINKIVFASSSSVYGDNSDLPKKEDKTGNALSPYAVTKQVGEQYARVFHAIYNLDFIGLRYFNVFGPGQNPNGPYAAVIPLFITSIMKGKAPVIHGDGSQTRDFTYIENVVQANIKALFNEIPKAWNQVYNIAGGERTSVVDLARVICNLADSDIKPVFSPQREGDILHSFADISKAKELLEYTPEIDFRRGLKLAFEGFNKNPS